ncbi:hypothetical protein [Trinickia dinghuensis]|uniref:Uncharacterized protein n=1 Tax=Trinickia dinghuensis TaxID=2291023 RepID=A0A3D8JPA8_9BURK|nr:hypothetical protein [Trinickia dinghuensis]RDU94939.1 hypothetical protein DWV00_31215 [Trinickia dinghuensis]
MTTQRWALALAVAATGTAVTLSILSGWQRGGTLPERLVWVAIGVVLVVAAHLLPALAHAAAPRFRVVATGLWLGCMGATVFGHATFFLLAQMHAGERRAASVAQPALPAGRSLTVVMAERAVVETQLASSGVRRCVGYCPSLQARRASLAARLDALNAEAGDIRRREGQDDRVTAQRDALLADPVTSRLAALLGTTAARVDLLSGLMFAAVLEGVACLLWVLALGETPLPVPVPVVSEPTLTAVAPVAASTALPAETQPAVTVSTESHADETTSLGSALLSHNGTTPSRAPRDDPLSPLPDIGLIDDDLSRLMRDVTAGQVRPTVADIRRHLGCSQAKATALRRQLGARHAADHSAA